MKRLACILVVVLSPALAAQGPDSSATPQADQAEAGRLRAQIRHIWNEHVRSTLGLTDDQATKLQATEQRFDEQRQPIRAQQREINQALSTELASGTPNQDRVKQLLNERADNQLKLQQINRSEAREMQGYLTPVQHARYQEARRIFQDRIAKAREQRREERQRLPAPGPRPRRRPRP
jgi:Spy/CpxP family protein refolding chaperone